MSKLGSFKKTVQRQNAKTVAKEYADVNILANLARNGITLEDVKKETDRVRQETFEKTVFSVQKAVYASVAIVLARHGFSKEQCFDIVHEIDTVNLMADSVEDLAEQMEKEAGIKFNASEGVERIQLI